MSILQRTLCLFILFSFVLYVSSCKKAEEYLSDLFQTEIKIKQDIDLDINKLIPPGSGNIPSDTSIDYVPYLYTFNLYDLDTSIKNSTSNVANFSRNDIRSAKVDSLRIFLPLSTSVNENNIQYIKISALNNFMPIPFTISEIVNNFKLVPVSNSEYAYVLDFPVNQNQEFVQYMRPPATFINYIFEAKFKEPINFVIKDKYKIEFSYRFLFKK